MATKAKTTDPTAELAPIAGQLQAAREERARLGVEARAWQDEVAKLEHDLAGLARDDRLNSPTGSRDPRPRRPSCGSRSTSA